MKLTLKTATGETKAIYIDGEKVNEPPTKPETAEIYERHLANYGERYEEATSRLRWRGGLTDLRRFADTDETQAEKFAEAIADLEARIAIWQQALTSLRFANLGRETGEPALADYERQLQKWHEEERYRQMNEENPEAYTLHAVAVKKVIREAQARAKVKWNKLENYWMPKAVFATVNGLTLEEAEQALDDYIEARQMSYTVSTKNLKMKVA